MPARVFISHSSPPGDDAANRARNELVTCIAAAGFELLGDREGLRVGADWYKRINQWLDSCDAGVIPLGLSAVRSHFVEFEIAQLLGRHVRQGFPLFPSW